MVPPPRLRCASASAVTVAGLSLLVVASVVSAATALLTPGTGAHGANPGAAGAATMPVPQSVKGKWEQDVFAISMWSDPLSSNADISAAYKGVAEANFTVVLAVFGDIATPEAIQAKIDACEEHDLKLIIHARNDSLAALPTGPPVWGYHLWDEPGFELFPMLKSFVHNVSVQRPGALSYINLFPNYCYWFHPPYCNGTQPDCPCCYETYVDQYLDIVDPPLLCVDNYPGESPSTDPFVPNVDNREVYAANMDILRRKSLERGINFWTFFDSMPYNNHLDPTAGLIRWQIFTAVAYGAKGVLYFCYWDPEYDDEFPLGGALITHRGTETPAGLAKGVHYEQAREINSVLVAWGPTLMNLTNHDVALVNASTNGTASHAPAGCLVSRVWSSIEAWTSRMTVGCFVHSDGRQAAVIANYEFETTNWVTVEFASSEGEPVHALEVDKSSGAWAPVVDDSPNFPGLQLQFKVGAARLFVAPSV